MDRSGGDQSGPWDKSDQGFTLLEMLLTVFLIGLVTSLVTLNVGQDADDIAKLEARRFAALVGHLQDESTIAGLPMGVEVREIDNRYSFWELTDTWARVEKLEVLRERVVPEQISLIFTLLQKVKPEADGDSNKNQDGQNSESEDKSSSPEPKKLLVVDPTGITRPFIAKFSGKNMAFSVFLDNELNPVVAPESL